MARGKGKAASVMIDIQGNAATLVKAANDAKQSLSDLQKTTQKISGQISTALGAIGGAIAIQGIKSLGDSIVDLARKADSARGIENNFKALGGQAATLEAAFQRINGIASKVDLSSLYNKLASIGLPDLEKNFSLFVDFAARKAQAQGRDIESVLEDVKRAFATGSKEILENIDIIVNAEQASAEFAKGYGQQAKDLSELGRQEAIRAKLADSVRQAFEKLPPIQDSVTTAQKQLNVQWEETKRKLGEAIAESGALQDVTKALSAALKEIDWDAVARGVSLAGEAIKGLTQFTSAAVGIMADLGSTFASIVGAVIKGVASIGDAIDKANAAFANNPAKATADWLGRRWEDVKGIAGYVESFDQNYQLKNRSGAVAIPGPMLNGVTPPLSLPEFAKANVQTGQLSEDAKKYFRESESKTQSAGSSGQGAAAQKAVAKLFADSIQVETEAALERAITAIDISSFQTQAVKLADIAKAEFVDANAELVKQGAISAAQLEQLATAQRTKSLTASSQEWAAQVAKAAETTARFAGDALRESTESALESAISGLNITEFQTQAAKLADIVKTEFIDANSELVSSGELSLEKLYEYAEIERAKSLEKSAGQWGEKMSDEARRVAQELEVAFANLGSVLGENLSAGAQQGFAALGQQAGKIFETLEISSETASSIADGINIITRGIGAIGQAGQLDKAGNNNQGTGGAVGVGIGGAIGAYTGNPVAGASIGQLFGEVIGGLFPRGAQNPETQARQAFANWFEDQLKQLSSIAFYNQSGGLQVINAPTANFLQGPSNRFNTPNWADSFSSLNSTAQDTFKGLGEALQRVLGITEQVGPQIGAILADNLLGNIDNARLMVQQLNLSLEDMESALVDAGRRGEMSWHEVEVSLQGVTQAFGEGLVAVGDINGAFQELVGSGGRGVAALKGVRDIAVEALEKGVTNLQQLRWELLAGGVSEEEVNSFMNALAQRGIDSLEALKGASDRVAGGIVADIESASKTIAEKWADVTTQINAITDKLNAIPEQLTSNITLNIQSNIDDQTQDALDALKNADNPLNLGLETGVTALANGGIIRGPKRIGQYLTGEAGTEAVLPLSRLANGKLGVLSAGSSAGGMVIHIDARQAAAGVEHKIRREVAATLEQFGKRYGN